MGTINYIVLAAYLLGMLLIGLRFARRQKTTEDYFLAGRNMPWLPVAMSMFASVTSAITFMGLPSRAYGENIALIVVCVISPLLAPILIYCLYPVYRRHHVTTSYEYIGLRFGPAGRYAASGFFLLARLGWLATVIYAPALALSVTAGIPLWVAILLMGLMATLYTVLGGLAAVLWTDVAQFTILVAGAIWVAIDLTARVPGGVPAIMDVAREAGRLHIVDWKLDLFKMTGLGVAMSFFLSLMQEYGTDQVTVQRMLAVKSDRGVVKATIFNACTDVIMVSLLLFVGLGLLAYYTAFPEHMGDIKPDSVLPYYIITRLPAGFSGLIISAIFAAAMSSMDSGINSMATVIEHDFVRPIRAEKRRSGILARPAHDERQRSERRAVTESRICTLLLGTAATALAFVVTGFDHIIESFATFMSLFNAPVLALFILGMTSKKARLDGWFIGAATAIVATLLLKIVVGVHWVYYFPASFAITWIIGWTVGSLNSPEGTCADS